MKNIRVTYYHRHRVPGAHSIERLFNDIRAALPADIEFKLSFAKYPSRGFIPRLYNALEAVGRQGDINHITGDIHYVACFLDKNKTILTIHDCVMLERLKGRQKAILQFFWYILPVARSKIVTVVSESTKRELLRYVKCDPKKIRVIRNCISPSFKPSLRPFNSKCPRILQVGTGENKNLIRVAKALSGIPCHLRIIGRLNSEQVATLQYYKINYSAVADITDQEIIENYKEADIVVFASTYEGFGLPIIEANAIGRPVVTSNILSMPEVAGDAACLVNPYDINSIREGILRVINDKEYREQLIHNGLKNVERFQPDAVAEEYATLYRELVNQSQSD